MRLLKTLKELTNYIPNCLVCGKEMGLFLEGKFAPVSLSKPRWDSGNQRIKIKLALIDNVLHAKHKSHNLSFDITNNDILEGQDMVNRLMVNTINVNKACVTCHFKINTLYLGGNIKKETAFPTLTIQSEELNYMMKGGKSVRIVRNYFNDKEPAVHIWFDRKHFSEESIPLDFSKFRNLAHLNKRLATIKVFC